MLDLVVIVWSMLVASCATLATVHLMAWLNDRELRESPAFVGFSLTVAAAAFFELRMMHADTPDQYAFLLRWMHVVLLGMVVSLVWFVHTALPGGRRAWGYAAIGVRSVALLPNFLVGANLNWSAITDLHRFPFMGSVVAAPIGIPSPWTRLAELTSLLVMASVFDAMFANLRLGPERRRRALAIGVGLTVFIVAAAIVNGLVHRGLIEAPYMVSLPAMGLVVVVAVELSREVVSATRLARDLAESRHRNELAASAAGVGLWSWSTARGELWANQVARAMHAFPDAGEIDPRQVLDRMHPDDRDLARVTLQSALDGKPDLDVDYRTRTGSGRWRWIEARGAVERAPGGRIAMIRGVCMDISERRAAEERFRAVVEAAPSALLAVDADGRITLANRQAEAMFGSRPNGLLGHSIDDLAAGVATDRHRAHRRYYAGAPQARRMGAGRELRARRLDGTEFAIEVGLNPIQSPQGPLVLASIVDVSVRQQQERELQQLRDQTSNVARISLAGQLASTLAHELNQPLGAILRNAEAASILLKGGAGNNSEIAAILDDIRSDDQRAGSVIDHMRSLLRRKQAELVAVPVAPVMERVAALIRHDAEARHVAFELQVPDGLAPVRADAVLLEQVMLNLAFNAMDAMDRVPAATRRLLLGARLHGDTIELAVRDTGPGIPNEAFDRIFEPFYTTKVAGAGMGMGLAICRSLVESMGGRIEANNQIDGGAVLRVTLPRATSAVLP